RFGITREAIIGLGSYGLILAGLLNAPDSGYLVGKQAMRLLERYEADDLIAQAGFVDSTFIAHWKEPIANLAARCFEYYVQGLSKGDILYSGWNLYMRSTAQFYVGENFSTLLEGMKAQETFFQQHNLTNMWQKSVHERYFIHRLATPGYEDPAFDWEGIIGTFTDQNDLTGLFTLYSHHTICSLAMGNYREAWEMSLLAQKHADTVKSVFSYQLFGVYQAVAGLNFYGQASKSQQRTIRKTVKAVRARLEGTAKRQEENYRWGACFVDAEMERVLKGHLDPAAYHKALIAARAGKMTFPGSMVRTQFVRNLLVARHPDARDEYLKLRAELLNLDMLGVLTNLDDRFAPAFAELPPVSSGPRSSGSLLKHSNYVSGFQFDTQTFIKSIEALTGELQLDKLLNRLMTFAIENAGADYGVFLLRRDGTFRPVVAMNAEGIAAAASNGEENAIPTSIFNYVVQSGEVLRLGNASETTPFASDPLVLQNKERSVLCIPLKNKGQINAVIYLTNRLTENTFTEQRVGLLKVLAGQISLSIENALLYETMEKLVEERTSELEAEKKKSDHLLLNILPEQVAEELKQSGKARPRFYDQVTIMFCDFKNFTSYAESETPESLIATLDHCFRMFDKIIKKHNIEKIKTIGDAYLCVSGLPLANPTHALDVLKAAIEFQEWISNEAIEREKTGEKFLEIRIGIHTGSVVAGVVGDSKFAYDIWGDAVNTAARMEQSGQAGKINISAATYQLIVEHYHCVYRGKIQAKNKGMIDMYFVEKSLSELESQEGFSA
ncbi:MAG: GAF domain-containing protein, partial [Bacteroidetes bacterium]|nr:GAF domain-containing protein [Bacteroidota bacterium]